MGYECWGDSKCNELQLRKLKDLGGNWGRRRRHLDGGEPEEADEDRREDKTLGIAAGEVDHVARTRAGQLLSGCEKCISEEKNEKRE